MRVQNFKKHWEVDQSAVITPWRSYKSQRNKSLPDLKELSHIPVKTHPKIKYNKWYIKPEKRLKNNIVDQQDTQRHYTENFFYDQLYKAESKQLQKPFSKRLTKQFRSSCIEQICSDSQNIKMLNIYKHKKQSLSKRVPGVIDYLIKYSLKKEEEQKKADIRRRRIVG